MARHLLHGMTYEEAKKYFSNSDMVLLPVGSVEQHGPANPLGTDMFIAQALAEEAARRSGIITLPVIPIGVSFHHMRYPGTVTVSEH
ncbi:MAG: creatininase family protein, partial [Candidatus Korarchaeota archaeon]|nr:creatininase family protein [Candidatus Korarchaeota archaeon]